MAGGTLGAKQHPGIEKWAKWKEDAHVRFKFTPKRVWDMALWAVFVPGVVYWLIKDQQKKTELQNGRQGKYLGD